MIVGICVMVFAALALGFWYWVKTGRGKAITVLPGGKIAPPIPRPRSPLLEVSFDQALQSADLTVELGKYEKARLGYEFGLDPANIVIQAVSLAKDRNALTIAYEFSRRGMRLLKTGEAVIPLRDGGNYLMPMLSDRETGRFIELAKARRIDPSKLAQISSIVVSTAHVISGMDVVRKLEKLDRKLDVLLQGREIDQRVELEAIYQMARERLSGPVGAFDRQDMLRWRQDLYRLRAIWREELHELINSAPNPSDKKYFDWGTWRQKGREGKIREHVIDGAQKIRLARVAFVVDLCLAYETDTMAQFVTRTAPDEQQLWNPVAEAFQELGAKMETENGTYTKALADAVLGYRDAIAAMDFKTTRPFLLKN